MMYDALEPYWGGKMICPPGYRYVEDYQCIRHHFNVNSSDVAKALIQLSADDELNELYLNGNRVDGQYSDNWKVPTVIDVTKGLREGKNLLAVKFRNAGNIGGVLYEISILHKDGSFTTICSDEMAVGGEA